MADSVDWSYDPDWRQAKESSPKPSADRGDGVDWSYDENWTKPEGKPKRNAFAYANDFMIDTANAAAGLAKAGVDLVAPGSAASKAIGGFIESGQQSQSDWKKQQRAELNQKLANADGELDKAGIYLKHAITEDPLGTTAEAAGNLGPFGVAGKALQGANAAVRTAGTMGLAGGFSAGEVRGNIHEKIHITPDAELQASSPEYAALRKTLPEAEAKAQIGSSFARNAPEILAAGAVGALGGKYGLEGMAARVAPSRGRLANAAIGVLDEGSQGAVEQLASNVGVRRALPDQSLTEDVALNAAAEGILGLAGAAVGPTRGTRPSEEMGLDPAAGPLSAQPPLDSASGPMNPNAEQKLETQRPTQKDFEEALKEQVEPQIILDENGSPKSTTSKYEIDLFRSEMDARMAKRQRHIEAGERLRAARKPSEKMGIDPSAGPLSAAAAQAVDAGLSPAALPMQQAVAQAEGTDAAGAFAGDGNLDVDAAVTARPASGAPAVDQAASDSSASEPVEQQSRLGGWNQRLVDERERVQAAIEPEALPTDGTGNTQLEAAAAPAAEQTPAARWAAMTAEDRAAVAGGTDLAPVIRRNLPAAQWERLNPTVQAKLEQAMQAQASPPPAESEQSAAQTGDQIEQDQAQSLAAPAGGPVLGTAEATQTLDVPGIAETQQQSLAASDPPMGAEGPQAEAAATPIAMEAPVDQPTAASNAAGAAPKGYPDALRILLDRTDGNGSPDGLAGPEHADARTAIVAALTGQSVADIEAAPNFKFRTSVPQVERLLYDAAGIPPAKTLAARRVPFLDWVDAQTGQSAPAVDGADKAAPEVGATSDYSAADSADVGDDIRRSFAGRNARGADLHALSTAQRRIAAGEDAEAVRQETGWHRGVDGKLRFEISDDQAGIAVGGDTAAEVLDAAALDGGPVRVADVLDHPQLFAAYPHLADIRVEPMPAGERAAGRLQRTATGQRLQLRGDLKRTALASVMLHELQHAIQRAEGFATGGSKRALVSDLDPTGAQTYQRLAGEVEARNTQTRQRMTPAQRAAVAPEDTADVSPEDVIVTFNGEEMQRAPTPRNAISSAPITEASLLRALDRQFPGLAAPARVMLERGRRGEKGGLVVIDSADPAEIARIYAEKTGRDLNATAESLSMGEGVRGFFNRPTGTTFLIGPSLDRVTAPAVLLHEMIHGQQRARIDQQAMDMLMERAKEKDAATRAFLDRVAQRMVDADAAADSKEAAAYIVEQAVIEGRSQGYTMADSRFFAWADSAFGKRVGDFLRSVAAMVRTWMIRHGGIKALTIDDLVGYAMAGVERAADGDVVTSGGNAGRMHSMSDRSRVASEQAPDPAGDGMTGGATLFTARDWREWSSLPRFQNDDTSTVLFNSGSDGYIEVVKDGSNKPLSVFDGLFALTGPDTTYGPDVTAFRIPDDRLLSNHELNYELDYDTVADALIKVFPRSIEKDSDEFDVAWSAVVDDRSNFEEIGLEEDSSVREGSFMDLLGYSAGEAGEASWMAQRLRGRLAKELGFQAIEMSDENGTSWYIVPGVRSIPLNEPSAPEVSGIQFSRAGRSAAQKILDAGDAAAAKLDGWIDRKTKIPEGWNDKQKAAAKKFATFSPRQPVKSMLRGINDRLKDRAAQLIFDQFRPLMKVSQEAFMTAHLSKATDGALEAIATHGLPVLRDGALAVDKQDGGGFLNDLASLGSAQEANQFLMWVVANRAEKLAAEGRENLFSSEDIAAMKAFAQGTLADGRPRALAYAQAQARLTAYNKAVLDIAEKAGLINAEARKGWESEFYIPFYRVSEETGELDFSAGGTGLARQKVIQQLKGGTGNLGDPLANIMSNWHMMLAASMRNLAANKALTQGAKMGIAERLPEPSQAVPAAKGGTWTMENGQKVQWQVHDPMVAEALEALNFTGYNNPAMRAASKFKHMLTVGVTISPTFRIRNLMRDALQAVATADVGYNPLKNAVEGWKLTSKDSDTMAQLIAGGGAVRFGSFNDGQQAEYAKRMIAMGIRDNQILNTPDKLKNFFRRFYDSYQESGDRAETINRAVIYQRVLAETGSHLEASFAARDLMNFTSLGSSAAIRALAQVLPFFNARLQGMDRLVRGAAANPRRFWSVAGVIGMASALLYLLQGDDDEYKALPDYIRDSYWPVKLGGVWAYIPKPFEVGALGTVVERFTELMMAGSDYQARDFRDTLVGVLTNTLAMNPVPQIVKPIGEAWFNYDMFRGQPIDSMAMERLLPRERFNSNTSAAAVGIGRALDVSPQKVEHLVRGYFGWLGTQALNVGDLMARPFMDMPASPKRDMTQINNWLVAGDLFKEVGSTPSKYGERFYQVQREINAIYATASQARNLGDMEQYRELMSRPEMAARPLIANANRQMTQINQQMRAVMADRTMSVTDKSRRLSELRARRDEIARRVDERARGVAA